MERGRFAVTEQLSDPGQAEIVAAEVAARELLVIQLPNRILYASGQATVSAEGQQALADVGRALAQVQNRRFLVSGHTDDQPIRVQAQRFPSNWELSTTRGVAVLRILLEAGVPASSMGAAGFGEFDPLGPNDTDENRAANRRTELVVIPNLDAVFRARQ